MNASPPRPSPPFAQQLSSVLGAGALAAALATLPAAARASSEDTGTLGVWLVMVACALPPAVVAIAVLRGARDAWALFDGEDAWIDAAGVALWALGMLLLLTGLGAGLRATTHHHGLAGVTFAVVGVAVGALFALFVRRSIAIVKSFSTAGRSVLLVGTFASAALVVVSLALRLRADAPFSPSASALVIDALAFAFASTLASSRTLARGWLARAGIPLAVGFFAIGVAVLAKSPGALGAMRASAPAYAWLAGIAGAR